MRTTLTVIMMCLLTVTLNAQELFLFEENAKNGFKNDKGVIVIPAKYAFGSEFCEGLALVGKYKSDGVIIFGFINKTGKEITQLKYDYAEDFSEGMACVKLNDKYGFIDKTGKEVIPLIYDSADSFEDGKAFVELDGEYFDIDKTGERVE